MSQCIVEGRRQRRCARAAATRGRMGPARVYFVARRRRCALASPSSSLLVSASHYPCARPPVLPPRAPRCPLPPGATWLQSPGETPEERLAHLVGFVYLN